jgi:hypothetical protein
MKKFRTWFIVALMLVIFPVISWLYLKKGFDYRKQALIELSEVSNFNAALYVDTSHFKFYDKTSLFAFKYNDESISKVFDQFKDAPGFQIFTPQIDNDFTKLHNNWFFLDSSSIAVIQSDFMDADLILVDVNSEKRAIYYHDDADLYENIVKHIATIIRREKR